MSALIRSAASKVRWVQRARTIVFYVLAVLAAGLVGMLPSADPAHADTTIRVNSMADAGDNNPGNGTCATAPFPVETEPNCTLRAAIQEANVNGVSDTIIFDSFLSGTITLTVGQLTIANDTLVADDLIIQGPGARKITVSGNDATPVFRISQDTDTTISGLTISDGVNGGIVNDRGTLKLISSTVSGNSGGGGGGGLYNYIGTLELTNTTVSGNTAINSSGDGGFGGGIVNEDGEVQLTNSTVSGNISGGKGGGIHNFLNGTLKLISSTVSGNSGGSGGGIMNQLGTVRLTNTIVARNTAATNPDTQGTFTSQGNNLIGDTTGATGFVGSDLKNVDPLLGPLQDNGGPTDTQALLARSPAVDVANNLSCPFLDQRGMTRKDGNGDGTVVCDIGSFEQQDIVAPTVKSVSPTGKKVSPRANVTATFSELMNEASVEAPGTFTLKKKGTTTTIPATVTYDPATKKATLDPTKRLRSGATYIAKVTTAAKDMAGNALDQNSNTAGNQPKIWRFKVK